MFEKGVSKHYIAASGQAVDKEVYISKCLVKLKKFINEVHKNDEIMFWPDLRSAHYSNKVQDYLKGENIEFVPRDKKPANVSELRPIKDFWTEIKRLVYADNSQAENLRQTRDRIDYCMKKIDQNRVHRLGASTFTRVDRIRRNGLINEQFLFNFVKYKFLVILLFRLIKLITPFKRYFQSLSEFLVVTCYV